MIIWLRQHFIKSGTVQPAAQSLGRRFWLARAGAVAVEFALVAPVFLLLITGIIEAGRMLFIRSNLQFAVDEAARYALVQITPDMTQVKARLEGLILGLNLSAVTYDAVAVDFEGSTYTLVTASHQFTPMIPIVPLPTVNLSANARVPQTLGDLNPDEL